MRHRLLLLMLLAILALAAALRFYRLDGQSFWADEGNSVVLAQKSVGAILQAAAADIHPPAYYLLLKAWGAVWGLDEWGARSLSALLGVGVVWGIYLVGSALRNPRTGLMAASLAAIHPFLIYYSQEARMYQLLALAGVFSVWAFWHWLQDVQADARPPWAASLFFLGFAGLGLYTHYAFPIHWVTLNLVFLLWLLTWHPGWKAGVRILVYWVGLQGLLGLLFLPWLPIALRQIRTWPRPPVTLHGWPAFTTTFRWFICGPVPCHMHPVFLALLFLLTAGLLVWGTWRQYRSRTMAGWRLALPWLWLLLPLLAMVLARAFTPTFFKFLLLALPAWLLLLALGLDATGMPGWSRARGLVRPRTPHWSWETIRPPLLTSLIFLLLAWPAVPALATYYFDPAAARDNYRGIAAYLKAVAGPQDAIILTAPGQIDAFAQYDHGPAPVYPLPRQRPMDQAQTQAQLDAILAQAHRIFAIYWAEEQADPQGFIEHYLGQHAFKAWDAWVGRLRFVAYSAAAAPPPATFKHPVHFGENIQLLAAGVTQTPLQPGDIAQVQLRWMTTAPLQTRYKITLQLLDPANQVIAQVDSEPNGGTRPTPTWPPGEIIEDHYGLPIPLATPPGDYPLILAVYEADTGQRLSILEPAPQGDAWTLATVTIIPPAQAPPLSILNIPYPADQVRGPFRFLGHARYKQGFAHQPDTPLQPGDILHLTTFWQALQPPEGDYRFELRMDDVPLGRFHPAGPGYPTHLWDPGLPWRGEHAVPLPPDLATGRRHPLSLQLLDPENRPVGPPILLKPELRY